MWCLLHRIMRLKQHQSLLGIRALGEFPLSTKTIHASFQASDLIATCQFLFLDPSCSPFSCATSILRRLRTNMAGDRTAGPGLHGKIPGPSRDQHAPLTLLGLPPELRNRKASTSSSGPRIPTKIKSLGDCTCSYEQIRTCSIVPLLELQLRPDHLLTCCRCGWYRFMLPSCKMLHGRLG